MIIQLLELYKLIEENKQKFTDKGLNGDFFIDVYRSQPSEPELYEYFSLPAILWITSCRDKAGINLV